MTKRVTVVAAIGIFAAMAVPSLAFAQDDGQAGSGQPPAGGSTESSTSGGEQTPPETTTPPEPVVEEEPVASEETEQQITTEEEPEQDPVEPQVAAQSSTGGATSAGTSTSTASSSQATVTGTNKIRTKKARKGRKGKKSGKASCSTSSRAGGSPLATAAAPVAPGCTRLDGPNGVFQAPDGTTLTVVETSQGVIEVTVSGAPGGTYSGTLFVKGGPSSPGNPCVFNAVPNGTTVTCTTPINPNNGKFFGVSHVDACPPGFTPPPDTPGDTDRGRGGGQRREEERERRRRAAAREGSAPVAAAAVAAPGGQLPVTGLPVAWLILVGSGLVASGFAVRRMT